MAICHFGSPSTSAIQLGFLRAGELFPFTIEACDTRRKSDGQRLRTVDADNRVKMVVDPAGDDRHYGRTGAGVKLCGRYRMPYLDTSDGSLTTTFRSRLDWRSIPAVLVQNEQVRREPDLGGIKLPGERKGDVPGSGTYRGSHACDLRWFVVERKQGFQAFRSKCADRKRADRTMQAFAPTARDRDG